MSGGERDQRRTAQLVCGAAALGFAAVLLVLPWPGSLPSGAGFASPSGRPLRDTVFAALYWVAAANLVLSLGGLLTARWWTRPSSRPPVGAQAGLSPRTWAWVLLAALLALGLRLPLAEGSLWWDEAWSMRRVVTGLAQPSALDPEQLEVETPPWSRPFWDYRKPTNHVLYNVLGRVSVEGWRALSSGAPGSFSEVAFRAPALVASLLAVVGIALLLARLGFPEVAPAAAFLLAIHPWHLRHGAEGRAYGLVLVLALGASIALLGALRCGRWRDWISFGACQGLLLWAQPSAIYGAACLGGAALAGCVVRREPWSERAIQAGRLGVVGLGAAMVLAFVMAPNVAQSLAWTDVFQEEQRIGWAVLVDFWSTVATGIPVFTALEADPPSAFVSLPALGRGVGLLVLAVMPGLALLGWLRVAHRSPEAGALIAALLAWIALALFVTWWRHMYYYHRFLIHALVPLVIGLCVGGQWLIGRVVPVWMGARARSVAAALALGVYALAVWPQTQLLLTRSISPMRETAQALQGLAGEPTSHTLRGGLGLGGEMPALYDPWLQSLQTSEEFTALVARADAEGRPLYVTYGYAGTNRPRFPEVFMLLDDPARFTKVAEFRGIEAGFHYHILRYEGRGGAAAPEPSEDAAAAREEAPAAVQ